MNEKLKAKWLEALRSGYIRQTRGYLYRRRSGSMCCLGVLCHVAGLERKIVRRRYPRYGNLDIKGNFYSFTYNKKSYLRILPRSFLKEIGMRLKSMEELVRLNDHSKRNFKYIANWIEKNL